MGSRWKVTRCALQPAWCLVISATLSHCVWYKVTVTSGVAVHVSAPYCGEHGRLLYIAKSADVPYIAWATCVRFTSTLRVQHLDLTNPHDGAQRAPQSITVMAHSGVVAWTGTVKCICSWNRLDAWTAVRMGTACGGRDSGLRPWQRFLLRAGEVRQLIRDPELLLWLNCSARLADTSCPRFCIAGRPSG